MSIIENILPKRRGRPSKAVAEAQAAVEKLDADLTRLNGKRDELIARQTDAQAKLATAKEARRAALATDPAADVESLSRTVREVEDHVTMFGEALADVDSMISAITADRESQDMQGKREVIAAHFEGIADAVSEAAVDLDKAVAAVSKAMEKLKSAVPDDYALINISGMGYGAFGQSARAKDLAAILLAESLYKSLPDAFIESRRTFALYRFFEIDSKPTTDLWGEMPSPLDAAGAATRLIGERNRAHADAIRRGEVDLASGRRIERAPDPQPEPEHPVYAQVEVFVTKDFRYVSSDLPFNCWEMCRRRGKRRMPEPVADAAVKAGVALRIDTPEGKAAYDADQRYRATALPSTSFPLHFEDYYDLGDPLGFFDGKEIPLPKGVLDRLNAA